MSADYSFIEKNLYLGNLESASNVPLLKELEISHILTVNSHPLDLRTNELCFETFFVKADDVETEDLLSNFSDIVKIISVAQNTGKILIHCFHGVSRSCTVIIAFLMQKYKIGVEEALCRVKDKRSCASPNSGFLSQLKLFEKMNFRLDANNNNYKIYRLTMAGHCFKKCGNFVWKNFLNSDNLNSSVPQMQSFYKCRKCRHNLLNKKNKILHNQNCDPTYENFDEFNQICSRGIFSIPESFMVKLASLQLIGKLFCPKCNSKIGSFNVSRGHSCECGARMKPAFFIVPSKVDSV